MKKVRFYDKLQVKTMYVWPFASRQARRGYWHWIIWDRKMFEKRCKVIECEISYIFNKNFRQKIYNERFNNYFL